jgi:poly(3-hydroxybutyrate) depolymerase
MMILMLLAGMGGVVAAEDINASRAPIPSAGCGASDVTAGDLRQQTIEVGGIERMFSARVPDAHDGATPVPLWVYLHGSGGSMTEGIAYVGDVADEHGFALASPQDLREPSGK